MYRDGDVLGRYVVESFVASGGMGAVYRARHADTGERVAIKVLHRTTQRWSVLPGGVEDERFARAIRLLSQQQHPNIVRYVAHGTTPAGDSYLVMEWLDGRPLEMRLREGKLEPKEARLLARRVSEALSAVHAAGIVHRDLKPSNFHLVGGSIDRLKLIDFGIAHLEHVESIANDLIGTFRYMSPEQARGEPNLDGAAALLSRTKDGEKRSRAIVVTGEAGAGKTRLGAELVKRLCASRSDLGIAFSRGDPLGADAAFGGITQVLRAILGVWGKTPEVRRACVRARVAEHNDDVRIAEMIGEIVGVPFPESTLLRTARRDPAVMQDAMRAAIGDFVAAECKAQPWVVVLEDAHWGDLPSRSQVNFSNRAATLARSSSPSTSSAAEERIAPQDGWRRQRVRPSRATTSRKSSNVRRAGCVRKASTMASSISRSPRHIAGVESYATAQRTRRARPRNSRKGRHAGSMPCPRSYGRPARWGRTTSSPRGRTLPRANRAPTRQK